MGLIYHEDCRLLCVIARALNASDGTVCPMPQDFFPFGLDLFHSLNHISVHHLQQVSLLNMVLESLGNLQVLHMQQVSGIDRASHIGRESVQN